jgi:hypothetical protein
MNDALAAALAPVLRDLHSTGVPEPRIEERDWTDDPKMLSAMLWSPDGGGTGIFVSRYDSAHTQIAAMADQVQEWAIEELQWAGRTNWPPCPSHPTTHPMGAATHGGKAVWCCPIDGEVICDVGSLQSARGMKPLPPWLPAATSRKWHGRRFIEPLGYLRVRTLANPNWQRDTRWLARVLTRDTPTEDAEFRPLYDAAIAAARRYPRTITGQVDDDQAWYELLDAVDAILAVTHRRHIAAVREAGLSGKDVPAD